MQKIIQDRNRIFNQLNNLKCALFQETLAQNVKKILSDHPDLFEAIDDKSELAGSVQNSVNNINFSTSRIDLILFELRKFTEYQLTDPSFAVLSTDEYEALSQTYSKPLKENIESIRSLLLDFNEIVGLVYNKCEKIYLELKSAVETFKDSESSGNSKGYAAATAVASAALIAYIAREAAVKAIAGVIGGGGVLGIALAAYAIYDAKKKFDKHKQDSLRKVKLSKIDAGHKYREDLEIMDEAIKFFKQMLKKIKDRQSKLNELKMNDNVMFKVIDKFEKILIEKYKQTVNEGVSVNEGDFKGFLGLLGEAEVLAHDIKHCL